jgi:hypothetical protein
MANKWSTSDAWHNKRDSGSGASEEVKRPGLVAESIVGCSQRAQRVGERLGSEGDCPWCVVNSFVVFCFVFENDVNSFRVLGAELGNISACITNFGQL